MSNRQTPPQPAIFKNNSPVNGWISAPAVMAVIIYMTYDVAFDEGGWSIGRMAILAVWLIMPAVAVWTLCQPRIIITVGRDGVVAREIWLWRTRETRHAAADLFVPDIVERKGSEGDVEYQCLLRLPDGRVLTVCEVSSRKRAEEVHVRLLSALGAS